MSSVVEAGATSRASIATICFSDLPCGLQIISITLTYHQIVEENENSMQYSATKTKSVFTVIVRTLRKKSVDFMED